LDFPVFERNYPDAASKTGLSMPVLKNPRHERFAQGVCKGMSQTDAYLYAGYAPLKEAKDTRSSAAALAKNAGVSGRIEEIQAAQAARVGITVDTLLMELQEMLVLAKRIKQPSAGVGAILAKGKLLGLITDKVETNDVTRKPARRPTTQTSMSIDEWKDKFAPDEPKAVVQ
jgi:hypothetical protein